MSVRVAVRKAVVAKLESVLSDVYSPYLVVNISYRPTRAPIELPAVVFRDDGVRSDDVVPLDDRTLYFDVFTAGDLDLAEGIAKVIDDAFDHQRLTLPGDEGLVAACLKQRDADLPESDADLVRKTLQYRLLVYDYEAPQPFQ